MWSRCIPPIKWIQNTFTPPRDDDWTRVAYQPMAYLAAFIAAIMILLFGDFTNLPAHGGIDEDRQYGLFWIWGMLSLIAPPLALVSLWIIQHRDGTTRYRGLWLRLGADIMQFIALLIYTILRIAVGDYHIYPVSFLIATTVFVAHLIMRDIRRLKQIEQLTFHLHHNGHDSW